MEESDKGPREDGLVECGMCKKLIPPSEATSPEGHEYVLWFCGGECHAQWEREQAEAVERSFGEQSGVPKD